MNTSTIAGPEWSAPNAFIVGPNEIGVAYEYALWAMRRDNCATPPTMIGFNCDGSLRYPPELKHLDPNTKT